MLISLKVISKTIFKHFKNWDDPYHILIKIINILLLMVLCECNFKVVY